MGMQVNLTQCGHGDCIWVRCENKKYGAINLVIDSGDSKRNKPLPFTKNQASHTAFLQILEKILQRKERLDLLVFTHDDNDHIKSAALLIQSLKNSETTSLKIIDDLTPDRLLFNFGGTAIHSGIGAETMLKIEEAMAVDFHKIGFILADAINVGSNLVQVRWNNGNSRVLRGEECKEENGKEAVLTLSILSPDRDSLINYVTNEPLFQKYAIRDPSKKEWPEQWTRSVQSYYDKLDYIMDVSDKKLSNGASVAFILEYDNIRGLFCGDSWPETIVKYGKLLLKNGEMSFHLDFMKLPHHGSEKNISKALLELFPSDAYLISSKGNIAYKHPSKIVLAALMAYTDLNEVPLYCNYNWYSKKPFKDDAEWEDEAGVEAIFTAMDAKKRKKSVHCYQICDLEADHKYPWQGQKNLTFESLKEGVTQISEEVKK